MIGQTVGYVRVSSADQNAARQIDQLGECDRVFTDTVSGKSKAPRSGLHELIRYVIFRSRLQTLGSVSGVVQSASERWLFSSRVQ